MRTIETQAPGPPDSTLTIHLPPDVPPGRPLHNPSFPRKRESKNRPSQVGEVDSPPPPHAVLEVMQSSPPGKHRIVLKIDDPPLDLPIHDRGPWPKRFSLRREELYGDNGR